MVAYYAKLIDSYPLVLLEDGMAQDDRSGWQKLNQALGDRIELVGDDVFCTNPEIIARGIKENIANAVLIKLNQIGALTETIADMTVALDTGHLKTGAPARGERVEKYNQLLRIEQQLGVAATYAGTGAYVHKPQWQAS